MYRKKENLGRPYLSCFSDIFFFYPSISFLFLNYKFDEETSILFLFSIFKFDEET